jgi:hypothetical protein
MDEIMQDVLALARKKMEEAGEYGQEAYREFIEESVDYYLEKGRLSDEDDLDAIKQELFEMYDEVANKESDEAKDKADSEDDDEDEEDDEDDDEDEDEDDEEEKEEKTEEDEEDDE